MTPDDAASRTPEEQAHRLYWYSDHGVNAIADELGLSKSRLYDFVQPLPAGSLCPECGRELVFPTRTARDRGTPDCPEGCEEAMAVSELADLPSLAELSDPRRILAGVALGAAACFLLVRLVRR
jgi:hypothetical protein